MYATIYTVVLSAASVAAALVATSRACVQPFERASVVLVHNPLTCVCVRGARGARCVRGRMGCSIACSMAVPAGSIGSACCSIIRVFAWLLWFLLICLAWSMDPVPMVCSDHAMILPPWFPFCLLFNDKFDVNISSYS